MSFSRRLADTTSPSSKAPQEGGGAMGEKKKGYAELALLVGTWYLSSCVAITTSKICMQMASVPVVLCATQFLTATCLTRLAMKSSPKLMRREEFWGAARVAAAYGAGFATTNLAFSMAQAWFVETVKAGEPVTTAALAAGLLGEREKGSTYASLIPIVCGIAMATTKGGEGFGLLFSFTTLVVLASNVSFSLRAVFVKSLKRTLPDFEASKSPVVLFYHVSRLGFPCFLLFAAVNGQLVSAFAALADQRAGTGVGQFVAIFVANGIAYSSYNLCSFMVLDRVSTTTHAVLNVFRRVVVIIITSIYFSTPLSWTGVCGVALAAFGVALYANSKE